MSKEQWIDKRENERIRIAVSEFNDRQYIDVRQYFENEDGDWKPTKKGVTIALDRWEEFKAAVNSLSVPES